MAEKEKMNILPVYLVLDSSHSMGEEDSSSSIPFESALEFLPKLYDELVASSTLADKIRVEVITFGEGARPVVPLSSKEQLKSYLENIKNTPPVADEGATHYGDAFEVLRSEIEKGAAQLMADNYRVHRPVVFFITDGLPNDDDPAVRRRNYSRLTDPSFNLRPNIVCVGVGLATVDSLKEYAASSYKMGKYTTGNKHFVLVAKDGVPPAKAISAIIPTLVQSIIGSFSGESSQSSNSIEIFADQDDIFDELEEIWQDNT